MPHLFRIAMPALILASVAAPAVHAAEYCVGSVAELDTALLVASLPTGQPTIVKLRQGTYAVAQSRLAALSDYNALQLLGGYGADCATRTPNPANTILDGGGQTIRGLNMRGNLLVEGLRFRNMTGYSSGGGWWLSRASDSDAAVTLTLRHNEFIGLGVLIYGPYGDDMRAILVNNRFSGSATFGVEIDYHRCDDCTAVLTSNTIVGNGEHGIYATTPGTLRLENNIIWGHPLRDVYVRRNRDNDAGSALYRNTLYGTRYGAEAAGSTGSLGDPPLFVDAAAGNHRLQAGSPAVNSGTTSAYLAGLDLDGRPRVVGSAVDRGAYESIVDDTLPTTLVVTSTADSGAGSLRQAITQANANPDFTYIDFAIAGSCPSTITLVSALPALATSLRINGWTQPGSVANSSETADNATRCVILDGGGTIGYGIDFAGPDAAQLWLQGLAFGGFAGAGLRLRNGSNAIVWGNQFGGRVGSDNLRANALGIALTQNAQNASIGGDSPAQRNVIAGSLADGISVGTGGGSASRGHRIVGNLIGTWGAGMAVAGNTVGIRITTDGNEVRDNVVVHAASDGVVLAGIAANGNIVADNRIGVVWPLCLPWPLGCTSEQAPNLRHGLRIEGGAHDNSARANTIRHNAAAGVSIAGSSQRNRLSENAIHANGGRGIDLAGVGANDNDADPAAGNLPNRGLNHPDIVLATGGTRRGRVTGNLASTNAIYAIEAFASSQVDGLPDGEGERFVGRTGVAIGNAAVGQNGSAGFAFGITSAAESLAGQSITLTATDAVGNTSGYSLHVAYLCDVIFRNGIDDTASDGCPAP